MAPIDIASTRFLFADGPPHIVRRAEVNYISVLGLHLLLAIILQASPSRAPLLGTLHCIVTCAVASWAILRWKPAEIACVAAYVAGADVLWRMTGAYVPWEVAKYIIVVLCLGGVLRLGRRATWNYLALVYIVALLPSIAGSLEYQGTLKGGVLQALSFNLSGPLCLFASAWYMSQLRLTRRELRALLISLVAPILTIGAVTILMTHAASDLSFTDESSFATSGGFGPNQVSAALGLGALASLILAIDPEGRSWKTFVSVALMLFFIIQSAMTFSRGGLYGFAAAFLLAAIMFLQDQRVRRRLLTITVFGVLVIAVGAYPRLEGFTGGALSERFSDTDPSHRTDIAREDMRLWGDHPILGVGPGVAPGERNGISKLAHTEYTRMLSEHGLFGVAALCALLGLSLTQLLRREPAREKAIRLAFMAWGLISMLHVGMRIAAIGLVFGWSCSRTLLARESTFEQPPIGHV